MERPFRDDFFLSSFKLTASIYYHFEKKIEFLEDPHNNTSFARFKIPSFNSYWISNN